MKQEGFNPKPVNIDQGPNPYKVETAKKESQELTSDIKKRIVEAEAYVAEHPEEETHYRMLINDMKEELEERQLVDQYSDGDELEVAKKRDNIASQIFSGKDNNPEILQ